MTVRTYRTIEEGMVLVSAAEWDAMYAAEGTADDHRPGTIDTGLATLRARLAERGVTEETHHYGNATLARAWAHDDEQMILTAVAIERDDVMHERVFGLMSRQDGTAPVRCGSRPAEAQATNDRDLVTCEACH